ncbi:MAG: cellulase family glycosylhydrolase [Bacteroidaceae bacterium]|nr:cellulase family glycosylhydrolase [Bacteroidaceae bacterium]
MKKSFYILFLFFFSLPLASYAQTSLPDIHVEGRQFVDSKGNRRVLHGVMDTPSRYFNSNRWDQPGWAWNKTYGTDMVPYCIEYFKSLFKHITDNTNGTYCDVFRLHLDPCWTNDPSKTATGGGGEDDISRFSRSRLNSFLKSLYMPIAKEALGRGLYVIVRPPGVCPGTIQVGDAYQQYLINVWTDVAKYIVTNMSDCQKKMMIELANEPVRVLDEEGYDSDYAMTDFFQPVVDAIRSTGFRGIVLVPGKTWQQDYRGYVEYPIFDTQANLAYAVHCYPGWYGNSDDNHSPASFIKSFKSSVPVVKNCPIVITEIDWSPMTDVLDPVNPKKPDGTPNYKNLGTWGSANTSKWGNDYKAMKDYFGNISMTLTSTDCYIDGESAHKRDVTEYGLMNAWKSDSKWSEGYKESSSYACWEWYKDYATDPKYKDNTVKTQFEIDEESKPAEEEYFPMTAEGFNPSIYEKGAFDPSTGLVTIGKYGFAGWEYDEAKDFTQHPYVIVEIEGSPCNGLDFRIFDEESYWSKPSIQKISSEKTVINLARQVKDEVGGSLNLKRIYRTGFWAYGGSFTLRTVYFSDDGVTPATGIDALYVNPTLESDASAPAYSIAGERVGADYKGIVIVNGKKYIRR